MLGDKFGNDTLDSQKEISIDEAIKYYEKATQIDNETYKKSYERLHNLYKQKIKELEENKTVQKNENLEEELENEKIISNMNYKLGLIYEYGKGKDKNINTAKSYYENAKDYKIAKKNEVNEDTVNGAAYRKLGSININETHNNIDDYDNAKSLFETAFNANDSGASIYVIQICNIVIEYFQNSKSDENVSVYNEFKESIIDIEIKKGNLNMLLFQNQEIDYEKIKELFKSGVYGNFNYIQISAENENEQSQFILGMIYKHGLIIEDEDNSNSENNLNIEIDNNQSKFWYNKTFENKYFVSFNIMKKKYNNFHENYGLSM